MAHPTTIKLLKSALKPRNFLIFPRLAPVVDMKTNLEQFLPLPNEPAGVSNTLRTGKNDIEEFDDFAGDDDLLLQWQTPRPDTSLTAAPKKILYDDDDDDDDDFEENTSFRANRRLSQISRPEATQPKDDGFVKPLPKTKKLTVSPNSTGAAEVRPDPSWAQKPVEQLEALLDGMKERKKQLADRILDMLDLENDGSVLVEGLKRDRLNLKQQISCLAGMIDERRRTALSVNVPDLTRPTMSTDISLPSIASQAPIPQTPIQHQPSIPPPNHVTIQSSPAVDVDRTLVPWRGLNFPWSNEIKKAMKQYQCHTTLSASHFHVEYSS